MEAEKKSLKDISWQVPESVYRADDALSYSTLARFDREGFEKLDTLFDKLDTPSLLLGSLVDTLVTDGQEEYDNKYLVAEFPNAPDSIIQIVKTVFTNCSDNFNSLEEVDDRYIMNAIDMYNYQPNWRPETRVKVVREKGSEYYNLLYVAGDKTVISTELNNKAHTMCNALKESDATKWYFQDDNPFENIERLYQLKFKSIFRTPLGGIVDYRCMADLIIVDHDQKVIIPCDLKTSGKKEYNFYKSFIDWSYSHQARLYSRIIKDNISKDNYFKDFKVLPYRFIVVNKDNLDPMVWEYEDTFERGTLYYGKNKDIIIRDPEEVGRELSYYLTSRPKRPLGIENENSLIEFLNKM